MTYILPECLGIMSAQPFVVSKFVLKLPNSSKFM